MKVKVGYITRWRRAIFFTLVACIVVFGLVSTVCAKLIEAALGTASVHRCICACIE